MSIEDIMSRFDKDRLQEVFDVFPEETEPRIIEEMNYFKSTNNLCFLSKIVDLIDKFRQEGVVWGVGRGSSCASLVMYLLCITDVNPLEYDISFVEFSKGYDPNDEH